MKDNERENDIFDELLRDALASDAAPSEDFTARLMEQVRRTPQEKPLEKQPVVKLLAALAACAVIVIAVPLLMPRMGSGAFDQMVSADSAAPEAAMNNADDRAAGDNQMMYPTVPEPDSTGGAPDDGLNSQLKQDEVPRDSHNDSVQALTLAGQDAKDAKAALDEMDVQPTKTETDRYIYDLTQQQVQELGQTVDALYGAEDGLILILEVTE